MKELNLDLTQPVTRRFTSDDIKRVSGKEPRIAVYMDERKKLPKVLESAGVFPLAVRNKVYVLVKGDAFHDLEEINGPPKRFTSSLTHPLLTAQQGVAEDRFSLWAFNSGLISEFTQEVDWFLTATGKRYSRPFKFRYGNSPLIEVESVQFQVDLLLESRKQVMITEVKANGRTSFGTKQLYYPFRHWKEEIPGKKTRTIFMVYEKKTQVFKFWEYEFTDALDFSTIELVKCESYTIESAQRTIEEFLDIEPEPLKSYPKNFRVPQADDILKVQELPLLVSKGINTSSSIAESFGFAIRQSSYYRDAAEGLGLVELEEDNRYKLTALGRWYVSLLVSERNNLFATLLLKHPLMKEVLDQLSTSKTGCIDKNAIAEIIRKNSNLGGKTPARRASTILSWFRWLGDAIGIVNVLDSKICLPNTTLS